MELIWLLLFLIMELLLATFLAPILNFYVATVILIVVAIPFIILTIKSAKKSRQKLDLINRSKKDSKIFKSK